ncbi:MAG: putative photosynthetic complex assembly protein PuhC [Pseudomonadota bacterium]|jgi:putative photosynthetic complex assembly protein
MSHSSSPLLSKTTVLVLALGVVAVFAAWVIQESRQIARYPDAPATLIKQLRFEDRADGSIAVVDYQTKQQVDVIIGEAGFVRGALRTLAQERKRREISSEPPFELIARQDGRLTLADPSTGRMIDLESFGAINSQHFARLLRADVNQIQQR